MLKKMEQSLELTLNYDIQAKQKQDSKGGNLESENLTELKGNE